MFLDLDHQILKVLRENKIENAFILVALSGGLDSVVLLTVLCSLKRVLHLNVKACYVHHGFSSDAQLLEYRHKAQQFCSDLSREMGVEFAALSLPNRDTKPELKNEQDLREFRYQLLYEQLQQGQIKQQNDGAGRWLVLAHHADDLLETRLQRLIRGTGPEGLKAMKFVETPLLRPLLSFTREDIRQYAVEKNLRWLEDPSNQDERFFRSWLRNKWIPELENRQPGAKKALARSLELVLEGFENIESAKEDLMPSLFLDQGLCRNEFEKLNLKNQKRVIAGYLTRLGCRNFSHCQIVEIVKQLDIHKKVHTFFAAQCRWNVSAARIVALRSDKTHDRLD